MACVLENEQFSFYQNVLVNGFLAKILSLHSKHLIHAQLYSPRLLPFNSPMLIVYYKTLSL